MKSFRNAAPLLLALFLFLPAGCPSPQTPADVPGDRKAAIARAEAALKASPQDETAKQNLVLLLLQEVEVARASKDNAAMDRLFARIFAVDPDSSLALYAHGKAMIEEGRTKEALASLEKLMRQNPQFSADLYNQLAAGYVKAGEIDKAREALLKSLSISPASFRTYKSLAEVYRLEGNPSEAERHETEAQAVEKYGYPDRGYRSKTVEEWSLEAVSFGQGPGLGMGMHDAGEGPEPAAGGTAEPPAGQGPGPMAGGHGGGHGPGGKRRALALYNLGTYIDRQIDPANVFSYDEAMRAWWTYLGFAKDMPEEKVFHAVVKDRVAALKKEKKALMKNAGLMPLEGVLGTSRKLNEALKSMPPILTKVKAAAEAAGDAETASQAQAMLDKLLAANTMPYQDRLRDINHQVKELMRRWQEKDPTLSEQAMLTEANRLGYELDKIKEEIKVQGLDQTMLETRKLAAKYRIKIPKHGGGEE